MPQIEPSPAPARAAPESILFFVPMYRCETQIARVIAQFEALEDLGIAYGVLCVDNRSPDRTLAVAEQALGASSVAHKALVRNDDNYGLGGSHKVAFDYARANGFDYVVVLHGDDQGAVTDLLPLIRNGDHRKVDALLGARFMKGASLEGYSFLRTAANEVFNGIFSAVARKRFYDLGSGLNIFRRAAFDDGFHRKFADDLTFNYYLVFGLADHGKSYRFFPITWREDDQVSNAKLFSQGVCMLKLLRQRIMSRDRFLTGEHRQVPRAAYPFTMIRDWPAQDAGGARP